VSAPGKALIAGGYLVTEHPNIGVVVSATSRFHSTICVLEGSGYTSISSDEIRIIVDSPQFYSSYEYMYKASSNTLIQCGSRENVFVEKCLFLTLSFIKEHLGERRFPVVLKKINELGSLGIKLRADNDFYSQIQKLKHEGLPLLSSSLSQLEHFLPAPKATDGTAEIAKTGMGSSAALATSLVGSLLEYFGCVGLNSNGSISLRMVASDKFVIHNLAQLAHAIAQGKVGSGFDVGAAVYGSILYRRFDAEALKVCLDAGPDLKTNILYEAVMNEKLWTQTTESFSLPPGLDMMMGDVCGGSSTTSMTRKVKAWLKNKPSESVPVWNGLAKANETIYDLFNSLAAAADEAEGAYTHSLQLISECSSSEWSTLKKRKEVNEIIAGLIDKWIMLHSQLVESRRLLKKMGECSDVDIEPDEQTRLADETMKIPGVLTAGVPGAGGVDAIFAITIGPMVREKIEKMWSEWSARTVCPLILSAEGRSEPCPGVRIEPSLKW